MKNKENKLYEKLIYAIFYLGGMWVWFITVSLNTFFLDYIYPDIDLLSFKGILYGTLFGLCVISFSLGMMLIYLKNIKEFLPK